MKTSLYLNYFIIFITLYLNDFPGKSRKHRRDSQTLQDTHYANPISSFQADGASVVFPYRKDSLSKKNLCFSILSPHSLRIIRKKMTGNAE